MFTQGNHRWGRNPVALLLGISVLAFAVGAQAQSDVTVTVTAQSFRFQDDTDITVEVALDNLQDVAGVELTLEYPVERFLGEPTWDAGDLAWNVEANPATPGEVAIATASAVGLGVDGGVLMTLTFPVPCDGNDVEGGQDLTFTFSGFQAFDENAQPLTATALDGTIHLTCGPVAAVPSSFGTLKAHYRPDPDIR
jgi:hypothetical protein